MLTFDQALSKAVLSFDEALSKAGYREDEPRDPHGRWAPTGAIRPIEAADLKGLTDAALDTQDMRQYVNAGDLLNQALRAGSTEHHDIVNKLDAFTASHELTKDALVYRGVHGDFAKVLATMKPGDTLVDPGFLSASSSARVAGLFTTRDDQPKGAVLEIIAAKGTKLGPLGNPDDFLREREFVFPRNTKLTFVSARTDMGGLTRIRFHIEPQVSKGYPEFRRDQKRDPKTGKWATSLLSRRNLRSLFPGAYVAVPPVKDGVQQVLVSGRGFRFSFSTGKNGELRISNITTLNTKDARNLARSVLDVIYQAALKTGSDKVTLEAGLESGGFVWPHMGFEVADPEGLWKVLSGRLTVIKDVFDRLQLGDFDKYQMAVTEAAGGRDPLFAHRIALLNNPPVSQGLFDTVIGPGRYRASKPTLGKMMLLGTFGDYYLPRARFDVLKQWSMTRKSFEEALSKGYPEFRRDQKRDPKTGKWSGGSGTPLRPGHEARDLLQRNLNARRTPTRSEFEASLTKEQQDFLRQRRDQLVKETPTDRLYRHSGKWDDTRAALHEKLIQQRLDDAMVRAKPAPGEAPKLVVMGGRPGSGKTTSLMESGFVPDMNKYLYVNADDLRGDNKQFKAGDDRYGLPGYEGWNSSLYHTEASEMMDELEKRGRELGLNIIHDATMRSASAAEKLVHDFEDAGYDISGLFVHASPENAALRAISRGMQPGGRFVPTYILGTHVNEAAFDAVKYRMSNWKLYDANGRQAHMVASGNKDRVTYVKAGFKQDEPRDEHGRWSATAMSFANVVKVREPSYKEKGAIDYYTDSSFVMNTALREGSRLKLWSHRELIDNLDGYISSFRTKDAALVWRSVPSSSVGSAKVGDVITDKAFVSVSASQKFIQDFSGFHKNAVLEIFVPPNSALAPSLDTTATSRKAEYVLPRGSSFTVVKKSGDTLYVKLHATTSKRVLSFDEALSKAGPPEAWSLTFDQALAKYRDDQPRVPKGSKDGGQWTAVGSGGSRGAVRIKRPIALYHGSSDPRRGLALPKTWSRAQGEDGHAVYLTDNKGEAGTYGQYVHKVNLHVRKSELLALDKPVRDQSALVKSVLRALVPEVFGSPKGIAQYGSKTVTGQDAYFYVANEFGGPEKASALLASKGVLGGYGESIIGGSRSKKVVSTVYSVYKPKKYIQVLGYQRGGAVGKAGYREDEARDYHGRWTNSVGSLGPTLTRGKIRSVSWSFGPSKPIREAIRHYTIHEREVNDALRSGDSPPKVRRIIDGLDAFIGSHRTTADGVVYRGTYGSGLQRLLDKMGVGDEIKVDSYWSTSINEKFAVEFSDSSRGQAVLEILVPKGSEVGPVYKYSEFEHKQKGEPEEEVLLPHGATYKHVGTRFEDWQISGVGSVPPRNKRVTYYQFVLQPPKQAGLLKAGPPDEPRDPHTGRWTGGSTPPEVGQPFHVFRLGSGVDLSKAADEFDKYREDQARVPKGQPGGGRWISEGFGDRSFAGSIRIEGSRNAPKVARAVRNVVKRLPKTHLAEVAREGLTFRVVKDMKAAVEGMPINYGELSEMHVVRGFFTPGERAITVGDVYGKWDLAGGIEGTVTHEFAHALVDSMEPPPYHGLVGTMIREYVQLPYSQKYNIELYNPIDRSEELFAELYRYTYGPRRNETLYFDTMTGAQVKRAFPETLKRMRALLG